MRAQSLAQSCRSWEMWPECKYRNGFQSIAAGRLGYLNSVSWASESTFSRLSQLLKVSTDKLLLWASRIILLGWLKVLGER